jgi:uncharacterized protein
MKFWDASAIVPLIVDEPETAALRSTAVTDPDIVVWWGTRVECASALARQRRDGGLTDADEREALGVLTTLADVWSEVLPTSAVRQTALRLLRVHALRAADALQLSAAMQWVSGNPRAASIVTRDERLATAADREGFTVL